jgi:hypothetical protein
MTAPQSRTPRFAGFTIAFGSEPGESATGGQTILCGSRCLERLVVGAPTRTDAAVARRIMRRLPSIADGWITCDAKCQAAKPTAGHTQLRPGLRGQSVTCTPRQRSSSRTAFAIATLS